MRMQSQGFTVFEIAIVTTIIALLISGIFVTKAITRSAELQGVMGDVDTYIKAVQSFRDKYHELPGDMPNAESFWGSDTGCPATAYTSTPHVKTCNGTGNGHIGDVYTDAGATNYEWFRAWQQLSDAGFAKYSFNGIAGAGSSSEALPGINVPPSKYEKGGFTMYFIAPSNFAADPNNFPASYNHIINFGAPVAGSLTNGPLLTPEEAMMVDQKMDDGLPAYGSVMTSKSALVPNCTTSDTPGSSRYNVSYTERACGLIFITGF